MPVTAAGGTFFGRSKSISAIGVGPLYPFESIRAGERGYRVSIFDALVRGRTVLFDIESYHWATAQIGCRGPN